MSVGTGMSANQYKHFNDGLYEKAEEPTVVIVDGTTIDVRYEGPFIPNMNVPTTVTPAVRVTSLREKQPKNA